MMQIFSGRVVRYALTVICLCVCQQQPCRARRMRGLNSRDQLTYSLMVDSFSMPYHGQHRETNSLDSSRPASVRLKFDRHLNFARDDVVFPSPPAVPSNSGVNDVCSDLDVISSNAKLERNRQKRKLKAVTII